MAVRCGGRTCDKNPRFRARYIEFSPEKFPNFPVDEAINEGKTYLLCVYDIMLNNDGELSDYRRISEDEDALGRKWYVFIKSCEEVRGTITKHTSIH